MARTKEGVEAIERVRRYVWYKREVGVCWRCGVAEALCEGAREGEREAEREGEREGEKGQQCRWSNVVLPALYGLRAAGLARIAAEGSSAASKTVLGQQGYREKGVFGRVSEADERGFGQWIGQQDSRRLRVREREVSKGFGAIFRAMVEEGEAREKKGKKSARRA